MDTISKTRKIISLVLKAAVIISAATGTFLSAYAGRGTFMGGSRVFMFFTIQSNVLMALICAAGVIFLFRKRAVSNTWRVIKLVGTVSITLTGVVFAVLLAPILGNKAWNLQNTLTHVVVPVAAVADYFVLLAGAGVKKRNVLYVLIPPFLYVIYAAVGYVQGWEFVKGQIYPYFFLNWGGPLGAFGFSNAFPFMGCVWWIAVLMLFLLLVGWCYLAITDRIAKSIVKKRRDEAAG